MESSAFATTCGVDLKKVIGLMKSLEVSELIVSAATDLSKLVLTPEALTYLSVGPSGVHTGSPEAQAFAAVPAEAGRPSFHDGIVHFFLSST